MKMKVFTISNGKVTEGARVGSFTLKGVGTTIPAVIVGEEGRGRRLGVLPTQLLPDNYKEWQQNGYTYIYFAELGTTRAGRPKLFQTEDANTEERCVCVFRTQIGFRGSNSHSGDLMEEFWAPNWFWRSKISDLGELKERYTEEEARQIAEHLNSSSERSYPWDVIFQRRLKFHPFPGEILAEGIIAQGDAGRMGSGEQLVAVLPANTVFRTGYSGRLYGAPSEHYYIYTNGQLLAATREERETTDIF